MRQCYIDPVTLVKLEELAQWGQQIMDQLGWHEGDSKRVTWTPTPRLLRYYTTLGILDRAARFQGRVALYTGKHLLQVLAIKRLQLAGNKLEDIQKMMLGLNEETLAQMLGLELPLPEPLQCQIVDTPAARRQDFWHELPTRPNPQPILVPVQQRQVTSVEPLPGLQVLVDPLQLPEGFSLAEFLHQLPLLVQQCRPQEGPIEEGGSQP
jgi:DNA-binding transcriptional MerR regulator